MEGGAGKDAHYRFHGADEYVGCGDIPDLMDDPKFFDHTREAEDITGKAIFVLSIVLIVASLIGFVMASV